MPKEHTGGWAEEPEGHAPSSPRSAGPAQSRCGLRAERAELWERAALGDPAAAGLARRLRSPSPRPSGRAACAAPERWRCTFRSVRRAMGLERRRAVGAPGRDPELSPLPGNGRGRAQRSGLRSAAEYALLGAAAAASRQVGVGAEGPPSGPYAQPAVAARPGSLSSEAGTAGARQRGQRTVIGRRLARVGTRRDRERAASLVEPRGWAPATDADLSGGSRTLPVFIPQKCTEPLRCASPVAERSPDAGRRQLPPLSF